MATFPGGVPALTNPLAGDPTTAPNHADQHGDANDEIEAIANHLLNTAAWVTTAKLGDATVTAAKLADPDTGTLNSGAIRYARQGKIVTVITTTGTSGATLPAGFRPAATVTTVAWAAGPDASGDTGPTSVTIDTAGVITSPYANIIYNVTFSTV